MTLKHNNYLKRIIYNSAQNRIKDTAQNHFALNVIIDKSLIFELGELEINDIIIYVYRIYHVNFDDGGGVHIT